MKFYKIIHKNFIRYIKRYDKIPDSSPNVFKQTSMIYLDEIYINKLINTYKLYKKSCFVEPEKLNSELRIYKAIEITENEYNDAVTYYNELITHIDNVFKQLS